MKRTPQHVARRVLERIVALSNPGREPSRGEMERVLWHLYDCDRWWVEQAFEMEDDLTDRFPKWSLHDFQAWREETIRIIDRCLADPSSTGVAGPFIAFLPSEVAVSLSVNPGQPTVCIHGPLKSILPLYLVALIRGAGIDSLLRCGQTSKAGGCNRVFVKSGRSEWCSTTCRKKFNMRLVRADEKTERRSRGKKTRKK